MSITIKKIDTGEILVSHTKTGSCAFYKKVEGSNHWEITFDLAADSIKWPTSIIDKKMMALLLKYGS